MTERDVPVGIIFPVGFQIQGQGARGAPLQRLSILGRELHELQVSTQLCQISPPSTALQLPSQGLFQTYSGGCSPRGTYAWLPLAPDCGSWWASSVYPGWAGKMAALHRVLASVRWPDGPGCSSWLSVETEPNSQQSESENEAAKQNQVSSWCTNCLKKCLRSSLCCALVDKPVGK